MSRGSEIKVTKEVIARQPAEARAIIRALLAQNAALTEHVAALNEQVAALNEQVAALNEQVAALKREVAELKDRLGKSPQNSSLPPSTQHPHAKSPAAKPKSKRKRGGQPGHPRHERALLPVEQCHEVVALKPTACRRCGVNFRDRDTYRVDLAPLRHQVWELPEIQPIVTEYQRHRWTCCGCGDSTCAELPAGVPTSTAGPRLVALTAMLMGCFRQSKRRVAMFLEQILGQPCSPGWVVKLQNQATAALRPAYEQLAAELPSQSHVSLDETPSKEGPTKAWLWTCVADTFTVFALRATRGACVVAELLGEAYGGVVTCDRAKAYFAVGATGRLQWCWAHLKRDFQALADSNVPQVARLGHDLLRPTKELFRHWSRCRDGTTTRTEFEQQMEPIRREIDGLLLRGAFSGNPRLVGMCESLYDHRDWLWTFVDVGNSACGIEPTNNASERALRHAVIWRKLSFGTQSAAGSRFVETILTAVETCRQQRRNLFAFLSKTNQAAQAHRQPPTLLPGA
jgi:transposase